MISFMNRLVYCLLWPHPRDSSLTSFSSIVRVQLPGDQLFVYRFGTGIGMEVLKLLILTMANIHWCFHRLLAECKALLPEILIPSPWPIGYSNAIYMDNLKNFVKSRIYKCIECKNLRFASFLGFKINKWILGFMVEISIRYLCFINLDFAPWIHQKRLIMLQYSWPSDNHGKNTVLIRPDECFGRKINSLT